jgi:hypothetical protein
VRARYAYRSRSARAYRRAPFKPTGHSDTLMPPRLLVPFASTLSRQSTCSAPWTAA